VTDDYLEVESAIAALQPEMILGTQMERHIGKRLGIPCAVISALRCMCRISRPATRPRWDWEGANVIFDTWVHPLDHGAGGASAPHVPRRFRISTTRPAPSHHGGQHSARPQPASPQPATDPQSTPALRPDSSQPLAAGTSGAEAAAAAAADGGSMPPEVAPATAPGQTETAAAPNVIWLSDAENELRKIPFFVRGKARRNTEKFAEARGLTRISVETLYEAKAHYAR
jgi:light-independent protochlorophyllide reductase subunit B